MRSGGGRFLVLDGVDGCGKSTQASLLVQHLAQGGGQPVHLREPGSTPLGERLRALVLEDGLRIDPGAELLLFAAARRQMMDERVRPALAAGEDVVCERFHPATFAYQAVAGGLDENETLALLQRVVGGPAPDHTVLLEIDVEEALRRRGAATDRIEARGADFLRRVAQGFRRYAELVPGVHVVDAHGAPEEVLARVLAVVGEHASSAASDAGPRAERAGGTP